jgi:beta-ureidopropionase
MLKAALIQMSTGLEKEPNVAKAERLVREAAAGGAKVVCLPELFSTVYFPFEIDPKYLPLAEPIPGPTTMRMQQICKEAQIVLVAPIFEKAIDGLLFNSAPVVGTQGELLGLYRKSSIPLTTLPPMVGLEKYYFAPGDSGFVVFDTPFDVRFGILICYDRHFPEAARALALKGAQLIVVPTATLGMSRDIWELELRAHAFANGCFVGGVNRVGPEQNGRAQFYGSSLWVDPTGRIIAQAGDSSDEILYADLDFELVTDIRTKWAFFRDRRPDLYGDLSRSV